MTNKSQISDSFLVHHRMSSCEQSADINARRILRPQAEDIVMGSMRASAYSTKVQADVHSTLLREDFKKEGNSNKRKLTKKVSWVWDEQEQCLSADRAAV